MRTRVTGPEAGAVTYTQRKRRDQLGECAVDAIAEAGSARTPVVEVPRWTAKPRPEPWSNDQPGTCQPTGDSPNQEDLVTPKEEK